MHGLCESKQISPEGCDWLKFALDPFHDLQLDNLRGYPDVATEPTVIVKVRQALEISAPAAVRTENQNWDCHIVLSPVDWAKPTAMLSSTAGPPGDDLHGYNVAGRFLPMGDPTAANPLSTPAGSFEGKGHSSDGVSGVLGRIDGLVVNSVPAAPANGGDMTYTPGHMPLVEGSAGYKLDQINLDNYLDFGDTDLGAYRLVYSGFEVVNTTAQIYKQGAVTVYEYGHSYETSQAVTFWNEDTTPPETGRGAQTVGTNTFRCPPNTIAEAKIMPGSHTWPAQEGCYCTAKFQCDNPFQTPTQRNYVIAQNQNSASTESGYGFSNTGGSIVSPGLVGTYDSTVGIKDNMTIGAWAAAPATHFSRMSTCGAYFTGLSPQSTLFITWRVGIERLPAANKPTFLALAQPSAVFDPNALALYNLIANHLPPGCPQGWNDMGRWFRTIADVAQQVIPAAFPLVGTAQMILRSMGAVKAATALPAVAQAAMAGVNAAKQRKQEAAAKLQAAARNKKKQKPAVQNFGTPGQRGSRKVQSFSQMA